ncbi:MAG: HD domain-containing protein [Ignavibacteria bacterium]|nr:HD domain-containing protein [Ignavibacteria bacterium]
MSAAAEPGWCQKFNEFRKRVIHSPENIFTGKTHYSKYTDILFGALREAVSESPLPADLLPVTDFAHKTLTPFTPAHILVLTHHPDSVPPVQDILPILRAKTRVIEHAFEFTVLPLYEPDSWSAEDAYRFLTGNRNMYIGDADACSYLESRLVEKLRLNGSRSFLDGISIIRHRRLERFGLTPLVVEPNISKTAGGLIDLFICTVLAKLLIPRQPYDLFTGKEEPSCFDQLAACNYIPEQDAAILKQALHVYACLRMYIHIQHRHAGDWLEEKEIFSLAHRKPLMPFMAISQPENPNNHIILFRFISSCLQTTYRTLTTLECFLLESQLHNYPDALTTHFELNLQLKADCLSLAAESVPDMSTIMQAFYYMGTEKAWFNGKLRNYIRNFQDSGDIQQKADSIRIFRKILQLGKSAGHVLEVMHELGFLGKFIPAFEELTGYAQFGPYYYYTTDGHTLHAINELCSLDLHTSYPGKIFAMLKDKELLLLGILLHDIAKPVSAQGHQLMGAEYAIGLLEEFGYDEDKVEAVALLIRYHFFMHRVAFRKDVRSQETIDAFATLFPTVTDLDNLFLLSYSVISAVSPMIFTPWKQVMLTELYKRTRTRISAITSDKPLVRSKTGNSMAHLKHKSFETHLATFDDPLYAEHFSEEEINWQIEKIEEGEPLSVLSVDGEYNTKFTVITRDSNFLLSKICGVLTINHVNILDARIFTRRDGIVVDTFTITQNGSHEPVSPERIQKVEEDLKAVISGMLQVGLEIKKYRAQWNALKRSLIKSENPARIRFETHDTYTVILIQAPDIPGFLYQITRKLNDLGLHIYFAKIATEDSSIYDAFYVLDRHKMKVSKHFFQLIETELMHIIEKL